RGTARRGGCVPYCLAPPPGTVGRGGGATPFLGGGKRGAPPPRSPVLAQQGAGTGTSAPEKGRTAPRSCMVSHRRGGWWVACVLGAMLLVISAGCSSKIPTYPERGTVVYKDGEPVRGGVTIWFEATTPPY